MNEDTIMKDDERSMMQAIFDMELDNKPRILPWEAKLLDEKPMINTHKSPTVNTFIPELSSARQDRQRHSFSDDCWTPSEVFASHMQDVGAASPNKSALLPVQPSPAEYFQSNPNDSFGFTDLTTIFIDEYKPKTANSPAPNKQRRQPGTSIIKDVDVGEVIIGKKALLRVERAMVPQLGSLSHEKQRIAVLQLDPSGVKRVKIVFGDCINDKEILVLLHLLEAIYREYTCNCYDDNTRIYHDKMQNYADKALNWKTEVCSTQGDNVTWIDRANVRAIDINIQDFLTKLGHTKKAAASGKARADLLKSLEALASIRLYPTDGITTVSCSLIEFAYINPKGKQTSKGYMRIVCNPLIVTATLNPIKGSYVNIDMFAVREIYKNGPRGALILYQQLCSRINAGSWSTHGYKMETLACYIYHDFTEKVRKKNVYHRMINVRNCIKCLIKAGWKFVWTENNKIKIFRPKNTYSIAQIQLTTIRQNRQ
jgi:hypothetical protein